MEDDPNFFLQMEDDLNILENGRRPNFFQMEDDLNILGNLENGRPQYFGNLKTTSISWLMEDDLNMWTN